jgi:hypothetical protein
MRYLVIIGVVFGLTFSGFCQDKKNNAALSYSIVPDDADVQALLDSADRYESQALRSPDKAGMYKALAINARQRAELKKRIRRIYKNGNSRQLAVTLAEYDKLESRQKTLESFLENQEKSGKPVVKCDNDFYDDLEKSADNVDKTLGRITGKSGK